MIGFILVPFVLALLIYIFTKTNNYIKSFNKKGTRFTSVPFGIFLFGGGASLIIAFFLKSGTSLKRTLFSLGYNWLGIMLYFAIGILFSIVIRLIIKLFFKNRFKANLINQISIVFIVIFTLSLSFYGYKNAHDLKITNYELTINKKANIKELNVVYVSDLHLGYNVGLKETKDMVNKINDLNPDIILMGGDIFDNEFEALEKPEELISLFKSLNSKYGVYTCLGNHDIQEKIFLGFTFNWGKKKSEVQISKEMLDFLKDSNIDILYDDYVLIEDIYIYGRPDVEKPNLGNSTRLIVNELIKKMDNNKAIIVLDHEPLEAKELNDSNVDVLLSGHTHNGQIWPGTISINWLWDNPYGYKQYGNLHNIVSSGVGLFGVNMRSDCIAEICNIKISLK